MICDRRELRPLGRWVGIVAVSSGLLLSSTTLMPKSAWAMSMKESIQVALEANPEIGEAIARREAIEFELKQAKGLYLPKIDLEARQAKQNVDNPSTRGAAQLTDEKFLDRKEFNVVASQLLFDGFGRRNEKRNQAARVDASSHRVYERSEFIALNVVQQYLEIGRSQRVVRFARQNVAYHRRVLGDLKEGAAAQAISVADRQQAEERVFAAEARLEEAVEDLHAARIRFFKLVGKPLEHYQQPGSIAAALPTSLQDALGTAREHNPTINIAEADVDAASALVKKANAEFLPKISFEVTTRVADDLDGIPGQENEYRAEVVMRWNVFKGGIDSANKQEQLRVLDGERFGLHKAHRDVGEAVRLSWDRRVQQRRRLDRLRSQLASTNRLINSYQEQFKVGDRSLLDLLDTQNTRFNAQVSVETANTALEFAEYRVLASMGMLLNTLHLEAPKQAKIYARDAHGVPPTPEGETHKRWEPKRGGLFGRRDK